ncbi:MAG: ATP-binding cassette domain-containing protein [Nitrospira sp.]|nr:ATP-binding cassette domain-containing protein [Nitrospira sp.]MCP9461559.1 ATP-binding cassette domain-containing protein [Nitrospira sp.]MCP9474728.1 ATP-binding cassette domain-containing protein [Nitrospira sp.]
MRECGSPVVRVTDVRKRYNRQWALDGIDLVVERGELYGVIGPDGSGKSSLLKAIAGVQTFDGGSIEVCGLPLASEREAERIKPKVGFLPQGLGASLYQELSVEENIDCFADLRSVPPDMTAERKAWLLHVTRLERFRDRPTKHLSGGMKQKLGLICALIHEPELVILDEPTTGIDPVSRQDLWSMLSALLHEKGMTALVSTSYMDEAERFHRLSFLSNGKVLIAGTPEAVRTSVEGAVAAFETTAPAVAVARLRQTFEQVETAGRSVRVFVGIGDREEARRSVEAVAGDLVGSPIAVEEPELEDIVVSLLARSGAKEQPPGEATGRGAPSDPEEVAMQANGLTRDFGNFRAVDGVSFRVRQGEVFGLLGANGAGKTTVIKMLTGLLAPTAGTGLVAGVDMKTAAGSIRERIGYVSQAFSLYLDLTVVENIRFFAGIYGLDRRTAAERGREIVVLAGLSGHESSLAGRLPMGLRQRLALGCALVHAPRVLFLDEPTAGVDPLGRRRFWDLLGMLARERGVAILITTHHLNEAERCDRLALMDAGRIVAEGTPEELKREVRREAGILFEVVVDQPSRAAACLQQGGFPNVSLYGATVRLLCGHPDDDLSRLRRELADRGIRVTSMRERPLSLEDVFVYRIKTLERQARSSGQPVSA